MLWSDFVSQVDDQLSVDANRRGLEAFRDRFMRNAVLDLQRFIPGYRQGLTTTYQKADVTVQDKCSLVQLPTGALPKELWIEWKDGPLCRRYRLDFYPWASRQDLICGKLDFMNWWAGCTWPDGCNTLPLSASGICWTESKAYVYAISPHGKSFLVYPAIDDDTQLFLIYDGYKTAFANGDTIPFSDGASEAVAAYLKWKITLEVDKNVPLAREHRIFYNERRLSLYRDWQDTQDAEGKGDEFGTAVLPVPAPFANAGAQEAIFLSAITQLQGAGTNALEAIATISLSVPYLVELYIGGNLQRWLLLSGTDATNVGGGILRPADYDGTTNTKVWYLLS